MWSKSYLTLSLSVVAVLQSSAYAAKPMPWNADNDPHIMSDKYIYQLNKLPLKASLPKEHAPWADNYWQSNRGGISFRWYGADTRALDEDKSQYFSYLPPTREEVARMSTEELKRLSPAEKFDILNGRYDYPTVAIERARTKEDAPGWEGICHGWIQAAIHHPEPEANVGVNPDGIVVPFGSADIKGLMSQYYGVKMYDFARGQRWVGRYNGQIQYLDSVDSQDGNVWKDLPADLKAEFSSYLADGAWCSTDAYLKGTYVAQYWIQKPQNAELKSQFDSCGGDKYCQSQVINGAVAANRDAMVNQCPLDLQKYLTVYPENLVKQVGLRTSNRRGLGNIFRGRIGINDVNPGAFHVILTNQIGIMNEAFGANINTSGAAGRITEVWNQPVTGFEVRFRKGNDGDDDDGDVSDVAFKKKVYVETDLYYVAEIYQRWSPVVGTGANNIVKETYRYRLDLDDAGNIIGGKWDKKRDHPNFLWTHKGLEFRGYYSKLNEIYKPRFSVTPAAPAPSVTAGLSVQPTVAEPVSYDYNTAPEHGFIY